MKTQKLLLSICMLALAVLLLAAAPAWAAPAGVTYYVSSSGGDDDYDGLSPAAPFRTLARVNGLALQPGDQVLFRCGDTWHGEMLTITQSGAAGQPVVFSAYPAGCADQPTIAGTQPVYGWAQVGENLYAADLSAGANAGRFAYGVNQLFRHGERLLLGRWPNLDDPDGGYSTIDSHPNATRITDNELPPGNWSGAVLHMKSIRWAILNRQVTGSSGTSLTVGSGLDCWAEGGNCSGWGYFLNNHVNTLDRDGEWAVSGSTLYLVSISGAPADGEVEASVILVEADRLWRSWGGINLGADYGAPISYVTVDNIRVWGWFRHGIATPTNMHPGEPHDLVIQNTTINDVDGIGLNLGTWVWGAQDGRPNGWRGGYNLVVSGNTIWRANEMGINLYSRASSFTGNTLSDIARIENLGAIGMGCGYDEGDASGGVCTEDGDGIRIKIDQPADTGNTNTFRGNRLERIGYNGFDVFGYGNTFEQNVVVQACISKGDCGGVRTFGRDNLSASAVHDLSFTQNMIINTIGNTDGCRDDFDALFGFGFYIDNYSRNIVISGNTVIGSTAHGILFQNSTGTADNNTLYNNGDNPDYEAGQLYITNGWDDPSYVSSSTGNIFFGLRPQARTLAAGSPERLGVSDHNVYFHPYRTNHIYAGGEYSLASWQSASGQDGHSSEHWYTQAAGEEPRSLIFYNDTPQTQAFDLGSIYYFDLDQKPVFGSLSLAPYTARILIDSGLVTDLAVSMELIGSAETAPGAPLTYTITLVNQGAADAANISLENLIPAEIVNTSWTVDPGMVTLQDGTRYAWLIANLPAGGMLVFTLQGQYASHVTAGMPLWVSAAASTASPESDLNNNAAGLHLGAWRFLYLPLVGR
ncbi:MAG TPA: hypothetical protein PKM21_06075 [Anaerolineales bacterium]|nr:hypothetical protein [Anaerolineales bacterium]